MIQGFNSIPQALSSALLLLVFSTLFLSTIETAHDRLQQPGDSICVECVDLMFEYEYTFNDIISKCHIRMLHTCNSRYILK